MSDESNVSEQKRLEMGAEGCQRWRRRNLRLMAAPHLRTSNRKCSAANSGTVNRRLNEAVAAVRTKSSATWKVGNVSERTKVRRCTAMEDLVHDAGNLESDAFRNTQPMKADECESLVVSNVSKCVEDCVCQIVSHPHCVFLLSVFRMCTSRAQNTN